MFARPRLGHRCVFAVFAFTIGAASAACSSSSGSSGACVADGTVTVTVSDMDVDSDSNFICNATVTIASGGGSPTTLTHQGFDGSDANCVYVTSVPPGTYTLTATDTGYSSMTQTLTVEQAGCVTSSPTAMIGLFESQQGNMADAGNDAAPAQEDGG